MVLLEYDGGYSATGRHGLVLHWAGPRRPVAHPGAIESPSR